MAEEYQILSEILRGNFEPPRSGIRNEITG